MHETQSSIQQLSFILPIPLYKLLFIISPLVLLVYHHYTKSSEVIKNSIKIYKFVFHQQKINSCHIKSSLKISQLIIFKQKTDSCEIKSFRVLNYLKNCKAAHKNNPRTPSLCQNKKAVSAKAVYFKSLYSRTFAETVKNVCATEFCIFGLVYVPNSSLKQALQAKISSLQ